MLCWRCIPWLILAGAIAAGCGTPVDDGGPRPPVGEPCEPGASDDFVLGVVVFDNPRWFRAFDDGCETLEMQTGLQGGWHVEPAIQAPSTAVNADLGGQIFWTVKSESGEELATAQFELFKSFWQTLAGGDAYWGDFVIFTRDPQSYVGSTLTIESRLEFDEQSNLADRTLVRTVTFVDEQPDTEFE